MRKRSPVGGIPPRPVNYLIVNHRTWTVQEAVSITPTKKLAAGYKPVEESLQSCNNEIRILRVSANHKAQFPPEDCSGVISLGNQKRERSLDMLQRYSRYF